VNDESVKRSLLINVCRRGSFEVFFLVLPSLGVLVLEDKMDLKSGLDVESERHVRCTYFVGSSTFIRTKHDDIR
jgi:hypothetical protein